MTAFDTPRFVVPDQNLIPVDPYLTSLYEIPPSRMFIIKLSLKKYREKYGAEAVTYDASQGDGGASLPGVAPEILDRAHEKLKAHGTGYDFPYGTDEFRKAVIEQYWQLDPALGWGPQNVVVTVGHFLIAPFLLSQTDAIATEPRRIMEPLGKLLNLKLLPPPAERKAA